MTLLITGILVFAIVHMIPAGAAGPRDRLMGSIGENAYKGIFGLLILGSIILMVFGWKATEAIEFYVAPEWGWIVALVLILAASIMFFSPYMASNVRRMFRHPQLMGIILFGIGHLAAVGNTRSIVLFGGLSLWALVETFLLNRRDGPRQKPEPASRKSDLKLLLAGLGFFLIFLFTHEGLFGVTPLPY